MKADTKCHTQDPIIIRTLENKIMILKVDRPAKIKFIGSTLERHQINIEFDENTPSDEEFDIKLVRIGEDEEEECTEDPDDKIYPIFKVDIKKKENE